MSTVYLILGVILFATTVTDAIITTFSTNGGGPITNHVSRAVWSVSLAASGRNGKSTILAYAGSAILVSVIMTWILGLWLGLFLVLLSEKASIVHSTTHVSTNALEKFYYAGFTLSTLGVGDYVASSDVWRVISSVSAFSGLVFITASITYFVPVLSAVNLQSKLSLFINSMGETPQQMLKNSWNGRNLSPFFENTSDLCDMIMQHTLHHRSYPVIHFCHNSKQQYAIIVSMVKLDEALQLMAHVVPHDAGGVDKLKLRMLQTAMSAYFGLIKENFLHGKNSHEEPPTPDLGLLLEEGVPMDKEKAMGYYARRETQRHRGLLTLLLESDGWSWQAVYNTEDDNLSYL
jgi:hypothetical protein